MATEQKGPPSLDLTERLSTPKNTGKPGKPALQTLRDEGWQPQMSSVTFSGFGGVALSQNMRHGKNRR
jgi:hypothetical protein